MKKNILTIISICCISVTANAQRDATPGIIRSQLKGLEYSIKAGANVGGTSPVPLPAEIRSIESYNPTLCTTLEGTVTKWFTNSKWGIESGIRLENKGMKTKAEVKDYNMEMISKEAGHVKGRWTGMVSTKVRNSYLTIPLAATYKLTPRWKLQGGLFASYMIEKEFSGTAYDGYLRDEDPTGEKVFLTEATYDFSDDLRKFQWGMQVGADWKAFKHLLVTTNFTWGFNNIFKSDFETITFNLYPIYLNIGFGYFF